MRTAVRQTPLRLDGWSGIELPAVMFTDDDGNDHLYIPLRLLVAALFGNDLNVDAQRRRVKRDALLDSHSRLCIIRTETRGDQEMLCLESIAIGRWINGLDTSSIRPELRERILEFQTQLMLMADRVLRGEVDSTPLIMLRQTRALQRQRRGSLEDDMRKFMLRVFELIGGMQMNMEQLHDIVENSEFVAPDGAYCCPACGYQGNRDEFAV